jgi:hypothetical protein
VPKNRLSGYEKFEAPNPAEWTARGYAIVNPDSREAFDSEGNMLYVLPGPHDSNFVPKSERYRCSADRTVAMVARKKVRMVTI